MSEEFGTVSTGEIIASSWANAIIDHAFEKFDDYIVRKNGSNYEVLYGGGPNKAGKIAKTESGLVAAIQWAQDQLSNGGSIGVKGTQFDEEWEATLNLNNPGITFHGSGHPMRTTPERYTFKAKDGLDANMINITGMKCHLENFTLNGNASGQSAGDWDGIHDNSGASGDTHLNDIYVTNCKGDGVYGNGGPVYYHGVYSEYNLRYGFAIAGSNGVYVNCYAHQNTLANFICGTGGTGIQNNKFIGCHASAGETNGFWVYRHHHGVFLGCMSYLNKQHGWLLDGAYLNSFGDCFSRDNGQLADNTYDGVHLKTSTDPCTRNKMQFIIESTLTNKHRYGIRENDADQDKNIVASGTISYGSVTDEISLQGANSIKSADVVEA